MIPVVVFCGICAFINACLFVVLIFQIYYKLRNTTTFDRLPGSLRVAWRLLKSFVYMIPLFNLTYLIGLKTLTLRPFKLKFIDKIHLCPQMDLMIMQLVEQVFPIVICGLFVFTTKEFLSTIDLTVQRYKQKSLIGRYSRVQVKKPYVITLVQVGVSRLATRWGRRKPILQ